MLSIKFSFVDVFTDFTRIFWVIHLFRLHNYGYKYIKS